MEKRIGRAIALFLLAAGAVAAISAPTLAQSSLGIGTAEPAMSPGAGPLAGTLQWINAQQQTFYRSLTNALKMMREDGSGLLLLVGLSFAYGVFHAAGPGHGKAVISSYMLANEVALRRGVVLSFASALLQAVSAIVLMGAVFFILRGTAVSMTDASRFLETASFALVALFGAWLLWRKLRPLIKSFFTRPLHSLSAAHSGGEAHHCTHEHHHHAHEHEPDEVCASCGHAHAPDPTRLSGNKLHWKTAWSAVAAVGLRPCSGALIVLTFSFLNALWLGGIASVFAMAFGTAITVSVLAILAVTAKNWAVAIAGGGAWSKRIHTVIEIGGALVVLLLGLVLLAASLLV
ncbi:nickel/cobalt transporter [Chelativorans sp. YIM 93263]|uniref:nickel/cobalt transporter n=1 Tax=Chelativorans sp. YIM 93263 TaxID=2906648 RepID=UPI002379DCD7|nr:nickel/cobalt transporter [Chelativorans sp. YIM 93263]